MQAVYQNPNFPEEKTKAFRQLWDLGRKLHFAFETHQSFDTYFKKLFHLNEENKIDEAKKILNLYFILEHLKDSTRQPENYNGEFFWKQSKVDKRYDALIAGLLKPLQGKAEPYCKVNFITWNYDLNLLSSLKNHLSPGSTFKEFLNKIDKENGVLSVGEYFSVLFMNGYFYSSEFDKLNNLDSVTQDEIHEIIFNRIKSENYFRIVVDEFSGTVLRNKDYDADLIKFAWETNNFNVEIAKSKMMESKNVVVIGYTFPLYNRLIDLGYLPQEIIQYKKIFIQDPQAEVIRQSLLDNYQLHNNEKFKSKVTPINNCDSFYIPSDIFGISEPQRIFAVSY